MAGTYPDVPGQRVAYDRDGSTGFYFQTSGTPSAFTTAQMRDINDESGDTFVDLGGPYIDGINAGAVFANPKNITGFFADIGVSNGTVDVQASTNSTDGQNGTWTSIGAGQWIDRDTPKTNPFYRNDNGVNPPGWTAVTFNNASAFRAVGTVIGGRWRVRSLMLYATPTGPADRLRMTDASSDIITGPAYFDWGDVSSGSQAQRTFRVKNLSGSLTAKAPTVGIEALTDNGTTPLVGMMSFSLDGVNFTPSITLPDLGPGVISQTITIRRMMPSLTPTGVWAQRIVASSGMWV